MGPRLTAVERARAAQQILEFVDQGGSLADGLRAGAEEFGVTEATVRRWVRDAEAEAAAEPEPEPAPGFDAAVFDLVAADPPSAATATKRKRDASRIVLVAAAIAAALVGSAVARSFFSSQSENDARRRVDAYVQGKDTREFVAADLGFRAEFPLGMPKRDAQTESVAGTSVEVVTYLTESGSRAFSVSSFELNGSPFDINGSVNGIAAAIDGHVDSATPTTVQIYPAVEFRISGEGFAVRGLVVHTPVRVYVVQAVGESDPAGYDAFTSSFKIDA